MHDDQDRDVAAPPQGPAARPRPADFAADARHILEHERVSDARRAEVHAALATHAHDGHALEAGRLLGEGRIDAGTRALVCARLAALPTDTDGGHR